MKTVILDPLPVEVQQLIQRRQALGLDRFDEIWEGNYHMTPGPSAAHAYLDRRLGIVLEPHAQAAGLVGTTAFNLGQPDDFRVPGGGYHRGVPSGTWVATAAVVVEIVSPNDETYEKFGFYARHGVDELLIADPEASTVTIWRRASHEGYEPTPASALFNLSAAHLTALVDWPTA